MATPKTESIKNFNQVIRSPGTFETVKIDNFFFLANTIENNIQKRAILLSSVVRKITNLCVPSSPNEVEYDTLMKCLNKYFKPIKSYFAARYTFYQAKQRQDESVFLVGTNNRPIQDRLLEEDASKVGVTYSTLIEIATAKEAAINDKNGWKKEEYADLKYQKKSNGHNQAKQGFNTHKELKIKCGICGRSNHFQKDCRYKDYECNNCGEKSHLSTVCKKGKKEIKNNKTQNMITIIITKHQLFSHIKLKNNDISLSDYDGNDIKPMGKIFVNSVYQNKKFTMCLYVIDNGGPPLIGRNDIKNIKCFTLFNMENDVSVDNIIKKYNNVFKDEIGTFNKY
ncbi:hypothetical protein AGLY_003297 [Aphis glycines]|uniref:CCHC-type domain-containing protein n=1 Tax=Aphis glycines TaxID=307491 RepID=A0A6G0U2H8_APHGL|nr:hypothetical protein AGLY_003297 [Aphis glycines]